MNYHQYVTYYQSTNRVTFHRFPFIILACGMEKLNHSCYRNSIVSSIEMRAHHTINSYDCGGNEKKVYKNIDEKKLFHPNSCFLLVLFSLCILDILAKALQKYREKEDR